MFTRNSKGVIGWFIISIFIGVISLPIMIYREIYQYNKYLKPCNIGFEWDDILRYGITIIIASTINFLLIKYFIL